MELTGPWNETAHRLSGAAYRGMINKAFEQAAMKEAQRLRTIMIDAFTSEGPPGEKWAPLSEFTILLNKAMGRTSRKILQVDGDLRNSHQVLKVSRGLIFVGVKANARGKDGESLFSLAVIHNKGTKTYTITVTDKMRKFFWWLHFATDGAIAPLNKSTTSLTIKIPARPWMDPIWKKEKGNSAENIASAVAARWHETMVPRGSR